VGTFEALTLLKSLCLPASVESIGTCCFSDPADDPPISFLEELTFEPGSKLRRIASLAFVGCHSLKFLCLPASIEDIEGGAFSESGLRDLQIEDGNSDFLIRDFFLMDTDEVCLLYYFGSASHVIIPDYIEIIAERCFCRCEQVSDVTFGSESKINVIESGGFEDCVSLRSFRVPASVISIGSECFTFCENLSEVEFESGSKLFEIDLDAFSYCSALQSIIIPSSVQSLGRNCLFGCRRLESVTIMADSQLVCLGDWVFAGCALLQSLFIPGSVESIGIGCFDRCTSLSKLTFGFPSDLETLLDIPPRWPGVHGIQNSVKHLGLCPDWTGASECVLVFGCQSKLEKVEPRRMKSGSSCRCFLQISSQSLKRIRTDLEFA
jgi:hypothetical protein